ncbi:MAG: sigma-70 family RNA polymerase sigma factor [Verrucomicrobiota bacterium]
MAEFQPTRWSLLQRAADADPQLQERAWDELHQLYRDPLFWFIRRAGNSPEQAEDILQNFFVKLAHRKWLDEVDPKLGKMRTFLLSRLKTHINDARKHDRAQKRGGQVEMVSIDDEDFGEVLADSSEDLSKAFDRRWARVILDRALARLEKESIDSGKADHFRLLRSQLTDDAPEKLRDAAGELGITEGALRVALHRIRSRFRELMRQEVADTLLPEDDVSAEISYLANVLAKG